MNLQELQDSDRIIYSVLGGSHAYGTNIATSDEDYRGYYWEPQASYTGLFPPLKSANNQVNDDKHDIVYYNLYRAFELLQTANPNQIELLWVPEDCVKAINHDIMDDMIAERNLFISKEAYMSHGQYARAQIKKARGQNKRVHNPQPKERPVKEDFCRVIRLDNLDMKYIHACIDDEPEGGFPSEENGWTYKGLFPFRPVPLNDTELNLSEYHVASLEHAHNIYRLYHYGENAKGVFRGDDMLVCESIPKEDEWAKIEGLLIYDKNEYDKAVKEWSAYWNWMKTRNPHRWKSQEGGRIDFDVKNMMHCVRLMYSGLNILTEGEPIVRFEGEQLQLLRDIRNEKYTYEDIISTVQNLEIKIEKALSSCGLPEKPDYDKLDKLYRHLMAKGEKLFS